MPDDDVACFRFLLQNTVNAYQRAKVGALNINCHVSTITADVKNSQHL